MHAQRMAKMPSVAKRLWRQVIPMKFRAVLGSCAAVFVGALAAGCGPTTPSAFDDIAAKIHCKSLIKQQLRDPDSYQFKAVKITGNSGQYNEYGEALISFRSKNGFGGYVDGVATCEAYDKNGSKWYRSKVLSR